MSGRWKWWLVLAVVLSIGVGVWVGYMVSARGALAVPRITMGDLYARHGPAMESVLSSAVEGAVGERMVLSDDERVWVDWWAWREAAAEIAPETEEQSWRLEGGLGADPEVPWRLGGARNGSRFPEIAVRVGASPEIQVVRSTVFHEASATDLGDRFEAKGGQGGAMQFSTREVDELGLAGMGGATLKFPVLPLGGDYLVVVDVIHGPWDERGRIEAADDGRFSGGVPLFDFKLGPPSALEDGRQIRVLTEEKRNNIGGLSPDGRAWRGALWSEGDKAHPLTRFEGVLGGARTFMMVGEALEPAPTAMTVHYPEEVRRVFFRIPDPTAEGGAGTEGARVGNLMDLSLPPGEVSFRGWAHYCDMVLGASFGGGADGEVSGNTLGDAYAELSALLEESGYSPNWDRENFVLTFVERKELSDILQGWWEEYVRGWF